jgi:hypothetical protein
LLDLSPALIFNLIVICVLFFSCGFIAGSTYKKKKIYRFPATGWIKIKDHPIPENIDKFIATDREEVSVERGVTYNSKGKPVMSYVSYGDDVLEITEWQPLPDAPRENREAIFQILTIPARLPLH